MSLNNGRRIAEHLSIGVLARQYPFPLVQRVLREQAKTSQRVRDLPAEVVVYYLIALGLFMSVSTREVLRCLVEGLRWLEGLPGVRVAGKAAISQARTRLGPEPLRALWTQTARPLAAEGQAQAFFGPWRLVALDGSTLEVSDTPANARHFGRSRNGQGLSGFPLLRFVGLMECGSHALLQAQLGAYTTGENTLAAELFPHLEPTMLCLADRGFCVPALWRKAAASGAHLLWRARRSEVFKVERVLADGSYLSSWRESAQRRPPGAQPMRVRVIEYELEGVAQPEAFYRLVTTILDEQQAPAQALAEQYPQRWEIEGCFDEFKTHLRGGRVVLRSKTPALVEQEFFGLLLAHRAVRTLMHEAAIESARDPDRISFTHSVRVLRRKLAAQPAFSPSAGRSDRRPSQ